MVAPVNSVVRNIHCRHRPAKWLPLVSPIGVAVVDYNCTVGEGGDLTGHVMSPVRVLGM
jgi:hypothetical protein